MKLDFAYNGELRTRLEQYSPQTHLGVHLYSSSEQFHNLFDQNPEHKEILDRFSSLPDVPNHQLTSYEDIMAYFVNSLEIPTSQQREIVERTLQSHFRKAKDVPDSELKDELTVIVARCIPPFLLEATANYPRFELFRTKRKEVNQYLHLPDKNDYLKLLSS